MSAFVVACRLSIDKLGQGFYQCAITKEKNMKYGMGYLCLMGALLICIACESTDDDDLMLDETRLPLLSQDETAEFAMEAQALLGGYELGALTAVTRHTHFAGKDEFAESKPSVTSDGVEIFSYHPTLKERGSEYESVWYKFKAPEAIDGVLSLPKTGRSAAADKIFELAFSKARQLVPEAAARVDAMGYTFSFGHKNMTTGSKWVPAKITLVLRSDKEVHLSAPTLVTSKLIPAVGGMSYCKVLTPSSAARLLVDIANGDHDRIPFEDPSEANLELAAGLLHSAARVSWSGLIGDVLSQSALLFVDKDYELSGEYRGTCLISPGAYIPSVSMRGLAKEIATQGYVVFVLEYPDDLAFWDVLDPRKTSYFNLADLIERRKTEKIRGLLPSVRSFYSGDASPVIIVGHSHGGAALGPVVFGRENPFDRIILSGVASFIKAPWQKTARAEKVDLFFGSEESKSEENLERALNELSIGLEPDSDGVYRSDTSDRTMQLIDGLNHFGIISDMTVGMDMARDGDGDGAKPSDSVRIFVETLVDRGSL